MGSVPANSPRSPTLKENAMKKNRELKSLDQKQLAQVKGGSGTQPVPWVVAPTPDDRSIPVGPN
jgi:hypothetical protein